MPRSLVHALIWSHKHQHYQLSSEGSPEQGFPPEDGQAFARWLDEHTAFAFVGQSGRISVLKEARRGGIGYWYAYRTQHRHTRKRYLGRTAQVTLARLEEVAKELTSEPSPLLLVSEPAAPPEQREALLSSKLAPPRLPLSLVERARLLDELDAVHTHPLTLVSASPGSGKTTLLSAWVEAHRQSERLRAAGPEPAVAWLSLETLDNDSIRFWSSIIAAVQTCLPRVGKAALAMLHQLSTPPLSTLLTLLLHEIGEARKELILVLDDYHVITDQIIHESLLFWLDHLPPTLHLVLISRTDPELPLARLRVRGQMAEIRSDDLRMTLAEAAYFLVQRMGLPLSEADVATLYQRTEGWIAGLHLAALSLRKQQDIPGWIADFAGSSRYLLDYVQQDILAGLPGPLQHFLLQTSILTRMNATVCQAIMAGPTQKMCQEMLEEVERANLFVVSLDEQRQWYRYHDLFREALLSALHTTQPELVPLLHRRAADFYEAQGQWHEAITHALAAADFSAAARLMEQTVEQFWVHGEAETMAHWMQALPERLVREHASLLLTTALYLLHTVTTTTGEQRERVRIEVQQLIARVETTLQRECDETSRQLSAPQAGTVSLPTDLNARRASEAQLQRRLRLLRMQMTLAEAATTGELEPFRSRQQEIEEELDRDEEIIWQMVPLSCGFILYYTIRNEGTLLVPRLLEARERAIRSGSPFAIIKVRQWLVLTAFEAGRLHLACEESQAALDQIERMAGFALLKGYFECGLVQVWYQWNRLEEARGRLRTIIQDAARWQHGDLLLWGCIDLMRVELARGELSAVQQALQEFEQLEAYQGYAHHWHWLPVIQAALWLAQGQVKKASDWAASVVFPQGAWDESLYIAFPVVIRVFFAEHRFREAASLLERWSVHLDRPTNISITLTYLAQSLVALHQVGKRDQARVVAARLLALTGPEGYIRVYLDEGEPMRQALQALLPPRSPSDELAPSITTYVSKLLAAFEHGAQGASRSLEATKTPGPVPSPVQSPSPPAPALVAPLTRHEQEVLRLLVAGQTYAEMAEALIVSVNTIKTQVSSIYRKLGVSRRAEAIAKAAQLHLLSPLDRV